MRRFFYAFLLLFTPNIVFAADKPHPAKDETAFAIVNTASRMASEALLYSGGPIFSGQQINYPAFLIKHGADLLLVDTGLGEKIESQFEQDMLFWQKPLFAFGRPVRPAVAQLAAEGLHVTNILISHSHWDHVSGLVDFPNALVWASAPERRLIAHPASGPGGAWPSQVSAPTIQWRTAPLQPQPYEGFDQSYDWYGDGSVVVVSLYGHTPGSLGVFVRTNKKRYFLVGDAVWSAAALEKGAPKAWPARAFVDAQADEAQRTLEKIRALAASDPNFVIVPAHDGKIQNKIGYFPQWAD